MAHAPVQALDVGAVKRGQGAVGTQRGVQQRPGWRAFVAAAVQRRHARLGKQAHLVLHTPHQAVAAAFQRLHPSATFLAQAQGQPGRGQTVVGRVGVHGLQAGALDTCGGHRAAQRNPTLGRHLKLQFGFQIAPS